MARLFPSFRRKSTAVYSVPIDGAERLPTPRTKTRYPFNRMRPGQRAFVPFNPLGVNCWLSQRLNLDQQLSKARRTGRLFRVDKTEHGWWIHCTVAKELQVLPTKARRALQRAELAKARRAKAFAHLLED